MIWSLRRLLWPLSGVAFLAATALWRGQFLGVYRVGPEVGASGAAMTLAALAAFFTYRRTAQPAFALVGVGAACVAANLIMFDLIWRKGSGYLVFTQLDTGKGADLMGSSLVSWLVLGICVLATAHRWQRPARRSIDLKVVVGVAAGVWAVLGALDLAIFFGHNRPGLAEAVLAWVAVAVWVAASWRSTLARGEQTAWLATAAAVAAGVPVAWLLASAHRLEDQQVAIAWYLTAPFVAGATIMLGCVASVPAEVSTDAGERSDAH